MKYIFISSSNILCVYRYGLANSAPHGVDLDHQHWLHLQQLENIHVTLLFACYLFLFHVLLISRESSSPYTGKCHLIQVSVILYR